MVTPVGMGIFGSFIQGQELENERRARSLQNLAQVIGIGGALQNQNFQGQMNPIALQMAQARLQELQNPQPDYKTVGGNLVQIPRTGQPTSVFTAPQEPQKLEVGVEGKPDQRQVGWGTPGSPAFTPVGPPKMGGTAADRPYFQFLPTAEGFAVGNTRTGGIDRPTIGGKPVIPSTSDPTLQGNISYGRNVADESAKVDVAQHETALAASDSIVKMDKLLEHLKSSQAITGLGAEVFKNLERAKVLASNSEQAGIAVSDTELLDAMMGQDVFPMIKSLGIGARGLDTPEERRFLRQVMSGEIQMNKQTLIKMTELRKDLTVRSIDRWNKRVESGELDRFFTTTGRPKQKIGGAAPTKAIKRTGTHNGRKVVEYEDGTIEYQP